MWVPRSRDLDILEQKISQLKREYDLYLAGRRRTEPLDLQAQIHNEILRLTRFPFPSTAVQYRLRTLGHRFQAVNTQAKNLLDARNTRRLKSEKAEAGRDPLVWDAKTLSDPKSMEEGVQQILKQMAGKTSKTMDDAASLRDKLGKAVKAHLDKPGVKAVRFRVVDDGNGPKVKGDLIKKD